MTSPPTVLGRPEAAVINIGSLVLEEEALPDPFFFDRLLLLSSKVYGLFVYEIWVFLTLMGPPTDMIGARPARIASYQGSVVYSTDHCKDLGKR